jgi:predicted SprT family Zn-dependent metalloprotease
MQVDEKQYHVAEAVAEARAVLAEHGLDGWSVVTDRAKRRLGICRYREKQIGLSRIHIEDDPRAAVRDTIRHEVAHALAYVRHGHRGHGPTWRRMCAVTGAEPRTTAGAAAKIAPRDYRWTGVCVLCKAAWNRHKLTARARTGRCGRCHGTIVWRGAN